MAIGHHSFKCPKTGGDKRWDKNRITWSLAKVKNAVSDGCLSVSFKWMDWNWVYMDISGRVG